VSLRGRCHCGAFDFELASEPITTGVRCNCSICVRRGVVMSAVYFPPEAFAQLSGAASLTCYQWGDHDMRSYFCATCGVFAFAEATAKPGHRRLNLGCIEGVDPLALSITLIDGQSY
jgi:hypothetical protein